MPFKLRNRTRTVARNIATVLSGSLVAQLATVAALPVLARIFSPADFGEYAIFLSVSTLVVVVATLRYEMAIVLPRSHREASAIVRLATIITICTSTLVAIAALAVVLTIPTLSIEWAWLILLVGPSAFLSGRSFMLSYWLMRMNMFAKLSLARIMQSVATAIAQILFGVLPLVENTAVGLVAGYVIGQFWALVFLSFVASSRAYRDEMRPLKSWTYLLRKHWRLPALTTPQSIVDAIQLSGINFAIGSVSTSALGQFSQAWRLVNFPVTLIGSAIGQVYFPELRNTPRRNLFAVAMKAISRSLAIGFIPFLVLFLLSPTLFPWLLGSEWTTAGLYAQALTPWLYLNLATSPMSTIFVVLNRQNVGLIFSVFYAAIPIAVLLLLRDDLYIAIIALSLTKSVLLLVNLAIVLALARAQGRRRRRTASPSV